MKFAAVTERLKGLGSDKWAVHIEGKHRQAKGDDLIFLSIGEPDALVPKAIMDVADRQMRAGRTRYSGGRGEPEILKALSEMYSKRTGRTVSERQFLFQPGTQSALCTAFWGIIDLGDEVLLPDPYYATYEGVIAAAGGVPVPVRTDPDRGFHLDRNAENARPSPQHAGQPDRHGVHSRGDRGDRRDLREARSVDRVRRSLCHPHLWQHGLRLAFR
jgi:arginine:pyruvate transaminase